MSTGTGFGYNYETKEKPSHGDILTVMIESRCYWPCNGRCKMFSAINELRRNT